jgi:Ni,Fe-hydrogenase III large subunit
MVAGADRALVPACRSAARVIAMQTDSLASVLSDFAASARQKPWPRYDVDAKSWERVGRALAAGEGDLLALWGEAKVVHMAVHAPTLDTPCVISLDAASGEFPSIGAHHAPAIRLERTINDLYGLKPVGAHDVRPWLDHGAWGVHVPLGKRQPVDTAVPTGYAFRPVIGEGLHLIPVGPVHAGIIEPGHFRFTANGETVARLEARLGYVHKGADGLLAGATLEKASRIVARLSGDSTVAFSFAFARAVEAALELRVPPRAQILRGVMAELERIANHVGDIGAICNDAAFPLIHAHCGIFREKVLAAADQVFAHRLMMNEIVPGGVAHDISADGIDTLIAMLDDVAPGFSEVVRVYDDTPSLQDRTCATGIVSPGLVKQWAAGGHVGRASARNFDSRRNLAYAPYDDLAYEVPVFEAGDVDARVWVRIREVEASMMMLRGWLYALPDGPIHVPVPSASEGIEGIAITEAFRGDVLVWVRMGADGTIARAHVRDASWFQWPLLEAAVENNIVADFPLCNKSFNCSYSGHDL